LPKVSPRDVELLRVLQERDAVETVVVLRDGRRLSVYDIAWGYDMGDEWAHVTSNISPGVEGASIDVFSTSEVLWVLDPASDIVLHQAKPGVAEGDAAGEVIRAG
jgi:hypothetical protein